MAAGASAEAMTAGGYGGRKCSSLRLGLGMIINDDVPLNLLLDGTSHGADKNTPAVCHRQFAVSAVACIPHAFPHSDGSDSG
jgi:hypothetical protein